MENSNTPEMNNINNNHHESEEIQCYALETNNTLSKMFLKYDAFYLRII